MSTGLEEHQKELLIDLDKKGLLTTQHDRENSVESSGGSDE